MPSTRLKPRQKPRMPLPYWMLLVILLLTIIAGGAWSYAGFRQKRELAAENARFAAAEQEVAQLTKDIVAATGPPLKVVTDKSCFLRSVKFEKQPISCSVTSDLFYEVDSIEKANKLQEISKRTTNRIWAFQATDINKSDHYNQVLIEPVQKSQINSSNYDHIVLSFASKTSHMKCSLVSYLYSPESSPFDEFQVNSNENFIYYTSPSCNDDSKTIRYGVR